MSCSHQGNASQPWGKFKRLLRKHLQQPNQFLSRLRCHMRNYRRQSFLALVNGRSAQPRNLCPPEVTRWSFVGLAEGLKIRGGKADPVRPAVLNSCRCRLAQSQANMHGSTAPCASCLKERLPKPLKRAGQTERSKRRIQTGVYGLQKGLYEDEKEGTRTATSYT